MKPSIFASVLAAAALATSAAAKEPQRRPDVQIPFDFKVNKVQMPAGDYRLRDTGVNFVTLTNIETGKSVHVMKGIGAGHHRSLEFRETETGRRLVRVS